jgi:hypothetical protein
MPVRTLLRGGHIISLDPEIGDIVGWDVLIEDEEIAAIALPSTLQTARSSTRRAPSSSPASSTRTGTPGRP